MKTLSLIVRKRKTDKGSFNSFSAKVGGLWYAVKFTQGCTPPPVISLGGDRLRAFIKLNEKSNFDVKKAEKDTDFNTLYVSDYEALSDAEVEAAKAVEKKIIDEFNEKRVRDRISFLDEI